MWRRGGVFVIVHFEPTTNGGVIFGVGVDVLEEGAGAIALSCLRGLGQVGKSTHQWLGSIIVQGGRENARDDT